MPDRLLNRWFDEMTVGDTETTRRRTVTETDVVNWCMFTGDWHPIHSDVVYSAESMFGARLAPGLMVVAIAGGLAVPAESAATLAQYGIDRIRYPTPTFIGDSISVRNTVAALDDRGDGTGVVDLEWTVINQNDTVTCSVLIRVLQAHRREG
ncbi:MAG: putative monoamine oxidase regulatory protein [Solirubrobacterales bacterium]|jgi:3-hydroxybutyryl-CoA dehydratase|nr:putative monoamine oxidase regulatory protein [Solirubrobacterales bacterium]